MSGRLILARHGQSTLDVEGRFSGTCDPDLSERGFREAEALAYSIRMKGSLVLDHVVSSGLVAARRTAEIVMRQIGYHHALEIDDGLDERDYGEMTGLTHDEALAKIGKDEVDRLAHGNFADDELLAQRSRRVYETRVVPRLRGGSIVLVVSYDDNLRAIAAGIDKEPIARDPWRTGMALDYGFDADMATIAKDAIQDWSWDR